MGKLTTFTSHDSVRLGGYVAGDSAKAAIIVVQEIFGVNSHIREVCDQYEALGYVAFAPALFDRVEPNCELGYDPEGIVKGRNIAQKLIDFEIAMGDIGAAAAHVCKEYGVKKVGVVGYCWGGLLAAAMCTQMADSLGGDLIEAGVSYYGARTQSLVHEPLVRPLMCHYGSQDNSIEPAHIENIKAGWPSAIVNIYDADHGFNCTQRGQYNGEMASLALSRSAEFFAKHLAE